MTTTTSTPSPCVNAKKTLRVTAAAISWLVCGFFVHFVRQTILNWPGEDVFVSLNNSLPHHTTNTRFRQNILYNSHIIVYNRTDANYTMQSIQAIVFYLGVVSRISRWRLVNDTKTKTQKIDLHTTVKIQRNCAFPERFAKKPLEIYLMYN